MAKYKNPVFKLSDIGDNIIELPNDYLNEENVFFVFIDVLGFKQTFDEYDIKPEERNKYIDNFRDVFCYYFELMNASNFLGKDSYAGQTSDSLYFYTKREDYLVEFIKMFSYLNLYAMTKNVFFRGGISCGNLYIKEPYQFYGNSVIKSYLLESIISKNPIVTVDKNTYSDIVRFDRGAKKYFRENKKSNRHYLNIFNWLTEKYPLDIKENSTIKIKEINDQDIKNNIEKNLGKFEYDDKNYSKYSFLLEEFNEYKANKNISVNDGIK